MKLKIEFKVYLSDNRHFRLDELFISSLSNLESPILVLLAHVLACYALSWDDVILKVEPRGVGVDCQLRGQR